MSDIRGNLWAVIMAGGAGTRFWPLSTRTRPKQFLRLFGERSLLQMSVDRVAAIVPKERILVLTNGDFVGITREQLPQIPADNVIGEPVRRDTSAAVCLAAALIERIDPDAIIATLTADHIITPVESFHDALLAAVDGAAAAADALYTFGIKPDYPATGYGYLELGERIDSRRGVEAFTLRRFKEKPDAKTAERYLGNGGYLWNSGMFVWRVGAILQELREHLPGHVAALSRVAGARGTSAWEDTLKRGFEGLETISIDFGVMEKAHDVRCIACDFAWNDVGGWLALAGYLSSDSSGNRFRGDLIAQDAHDNIVFCDDADETVVLLGVSDVVVARTSGRTLIVTKERAEQIKKIVSEHRLD